MSARSRDELLKKVTVAEIVSSRYVSGQRPDQWERRAPGSDVVRLSDGSVLNLLSDGGQSPPQPGWTIMLTGGDSAQGFRWTLYGIPRHGVPHQATS